MDLSGHNENDYHQVAKGMQPQKKSTMEPPRRVPSEVLLGQRGELVILHQGREYRLRLTRNGKLILTA